jgi:RND family efflux transporter MFP subunit
MKRILFLLVSIAGVGALIGWRLYDKAKDTQMQAQGRLAAAKSAPPVTVAPAEIRDLVRTYVGVGTVVAPFNVKVAPKVSGRLDFLEVREGTPVKRGEVLARVDPSQIQAMVNQQQAAVAEAQSRLSQAQLMRSPNNVNVSSQIQQQTEAVASARADAEQARQTANSQVVAARAAVTDAQAKVDVATSAIKNAEATVRSSTANVSNSQAKYNRTYDLYKQGFIAAQDVDDAKTALHVEQETLNVSSTQLNSSKALLALAVSQKSSADQQLAITITKTKSDIAAADAKVNQAVAALKYARANRAQNPAYEQNLAALRSVVVAAQAQLRNVQSQLEDCVLRSPIDGFVTARYVDPGAIISPTQPVVAVQALRDIFVDTTAPEDIAGLLRPGQTTDIQFDGLPGRKYHSTITQITPAADPQSRLFPVRTTLTNRDAAVKPGMFARVSMVTNRIADAIVVPREAVQRTKTEASVIVVDDRGIAQRRTVRVGAEDAKGIQILEGVSPKELVVTLSNGRIKDGQTVKPVLISAHEARAGSESTGKTPVSGGKHE